MQPLEGVKVIDFTHLLPGELASAILADLGCEIIRIERLEPGLVQLLSPMVKGESLYYWSLHGSERRVGVNLKHDGGVAIVRRLAQNADVLLENFRPGVMARLGLGWEELKEINPGLLYCSISSYGQNSAWSARPGHDLNLQAETGMLHLSRGIDGKPPVPSLLASDFMTGLFAVISVLAAIVARRSTGRGRHLDISMLDSTLYLECLALTARRFLGKDPHESDPAFRADLANYNVFKCKDGRYLAVASLEIPFWKRFCQKLARPELADSPSFGPNRGLREVLQEEISARTLDEWMEVFGDGDCCVSPVNTLSEALELLPVRERELFRTLIHPVLGNVEQLRAPLPFQRDSKPARATDDLAASGLEVLRSLGYSEQELEELQAQGTIASARTVPA